MGVKRRYTKHIAKKSNIKVDEPVCSLCDLRSSDPYLGQLLCQSNFYVHENCLFFSPVLNQELDPSSKRQGYVLGFKISDIEKEIRRICRLKCSICKEKKAGIGCCTATCRKSFHLTCGLQHSAMGIFVDTFQFYCREHAKHQDLTNQMMLCNGKVPECTICLELALDEDFDTSREDWDKWAHFVDLIQRREIIHGVCCNRSWMHRICMSRYGLSAGLHHVKCPNCGNTSSFVDTVQRFGIWLPDRDASWELEPGAFQDMYEHEANHIEVTESTERNDCTNNDSSSHNSDQLSRDLLAIKSEPVDCEPSPNQSNDVIQTDIRKYLTSPSSILMEIPQNVESRKRVRKSDTAIVPIKRRRRSHDKIIHSSTLIHRQCSRCSKSLVSFSHHSKSIGASKDGLDANDNYICVSCY